MSSYFINVKNKDGKYQHYKVEKEIYFYIRQLECCINFPKMSKLKEFYPERFGKGGVGKMTNLKIVVILYVKAKIKLTECMQRHFRQLCSKCKEYSNCKIYNNYVNRWTKLQKAIKGNKK